MRVLHVAQPRDGGVAGYVAAVGTDQVRRGWDVAVAGPPDGELAGAGVTHLPWPASRAPGPAVPREVRALRRLIRAYRPDVLHLHAAKAGLAGRLCVRGRIPTLFQPHGWSWLAVEGALRAATLAWERAGARWAGRLVCVGEQEAAEGRRAGIRGRYDIIRNGVDLDRFGYADDTARRAARLRLGVPAAAPLAVCVGRLTRQKGQDVLLAAWSDIVRRCPDARLALVGGGDLALRTDGVAGVRRAGPVADVRDWLAAANVVVLPSRWEGLPLTALEAMATGRSVVASDIPGLAEVVSPEMGALVPPERTGPLAEAVLARLLDPARSTMEGETAGRSAWRFDARRTHERLARLTEVLA